MGNQIATLSLNPKIGIPLNSTQKMLRITDIHFYRIFCNYQENQIGVFCIQFMDYENFLLNDNKF